MCEFPWIFAGITLLVLLWGVGMQRYTVTGTVLGLAAFCIFLSPVIRAYIIGKSLDENLDSTLGRDTAQIHRKPFAFARMITGIGAPSLEYQTLLYPSADTMLGIHYYPAQVSGNRPCIVVVHGGSWKGGDNDQLPELNSYLARRGYNVASINYRLAPEYKNPAPIEDVHAAFSYLRKHSEALHIDTNNFVLLGRSAGGQIVLLAAYTLHEPGLKGVISYYGPADMVWGYNNPANPLIFDSKKVMEDYLGGTYKQMPQKYEASSPILFVTPQSVPTLLIHGKNDVLVAYGHSTKLDARLNEVGVKHFLLTLPWATHGCDYTLNGPSGQLATYTVTRFLQSVIK